MAKIKKSRSGGTVVYPATIYQAVKDPNSGQRLDEKLAELDEATELVVSVEEEGDVNDPEADIVNEALRKTPQTLTKAEQTQARKNIGAASLEENSAFKTEMAESNEAFKTETNTKLSEIGSELESEMLMLNKRFNIYTGITHSSLDDRICCNIKKDELFEVKVYSPLETITSFQLWIVGTDGEGELFKLINNNSTNRITATKDIEAIGLYVSGSSITSDSFVECLLKTNAILSKETEFDKKIEQLNTDLSNDIIDVKRGLSNNVVQFSLEEGESHSSNNDRIYCNIKKGDIFAVKYESDIESLTAVSVFANTTKIGVMHNRNEHYFTAKEDVVSLGIYIESGSVTTGGTVSFSAKWGLLYKEIEQNLNYKTNTFFITKGSAHSSDNDRIICNIKKGEIFSVQYESDKYPKLSLFADIDGVNQRIAILNEGEETLFSAVGNISSVGMYLGAGDASADDMVSFSAKWGALYNELKKSTINSNKSTIDVQSFCSLFKQDCKADSYLFFTDPHLWDDGVTDIDRKNKIALIKNYSDSCTLSFVMCGGDWLTSGDTQDIACKKLGEIHGLMNSLFKDYVPMFGNHDNNYQGRLDEGSEINTGALSNNSMINLWFGKWGSIYYQYNTHLASYYIMDDGIDWSQEMDSYKWSQIDWLADSLLGSTKEHKVISKHMYYYNSAKAISPLSRNVVDLCAAFNNKESIILNGKTYDFSKGVGKVDYITVGHTHEDFNLVDNGIPVIGTINANVDNIMSFDLRFADYTNRKLHCIRVGVGSDRVIDF